MNELVTADTRAMQSAPASISDIHPLVRMFAEGDLNIEKFNQLMDAQKQIDELQAVKVFNLAMANFRAEVENVKKGSDGNYGKYADLGAVTSTVAKPLANNGLNYRWTDSQAKGEMTTTCIVTHAMGHSECATLTAPLDTSGSKNAVQQIGSTKTYLNRYTLLSALGLATEDDDGSSSSAKQQTAPVQAVETIDESDMADIVAVLTEHGKDPEKWKSLWTTKKGAGVGGIPLIAKTDKAAAISQIQRAAKKEAEAAAK